MSAAARGGVAASVKTTSPIGASEDAAITKSITDLVTTKLTSTDPTVVSSARRDLINDADNGDGTATADYQTHYIKALAKALAPMMDKGKQPLHDAAVILGGVAQKVEKNNVAAVLIPQIKTMLASDDPLVAYWGIKAARYAIAASVAKTGNDGGVGKLVIDRVKKGDNSGIMVEEAYQALTFNPAKGGAAAVAMVMELLEWRISQYDLGSTPPNPQAEKIATNYLSFTAWGVIAPKAADRDRAMKDVGDLACRQLTALKTAYEPDLGEAAASTGNAIGAIGSQLNDTGPGGLTDIASQFKNSIGPNMDTNAVAGKLFDATKAAFTKHNIQLAGP